MAKPACHPDGNPNTSRGSVSRAGLNVPRLSRPILSTAPSLSRATADTRKSAQNVPAGFLLQHRRRVHHVPMEDDVAPGVADLADHNGGQSAGCRALGARARTRARKLSEALARASPHCQETSAERRPSPDAAGGRPRSQSSRSPMYWSISPPKSSTGPVAITEHSGRASCGFACRPAARPSPSIRHVDEKARKRSSSSWAACRKPGNEANETCVVQ